MLGPKPNHHISDNTGIHSGSRRLNTSQFQVQVLVSLHIEHTEPMRFFSPMSEAVFLSDSGGALQAEVVRCQRRNRTSFRIR